MTGVSGTLFVAGMNHRTAPVAVREQLALEEEKIREILADLAGRGRATARRKVSRRGRGRARPRAPDRKSVV